MRILIAIALVVLAGCAGQRSTPTTAASSTEAELDVVVSFLQRYISHLPAGTPLVIKDTLSLPHLYSAKSLLSQASDRVPKDLIEDFCLKNSEPQPVWPELSAHLQVKLLSRGELDSIFAAKVGQKPNGWDKFYATYPKSPGIFTLSRVGFNRRGDMAMLYVGESSHWLAGSGRIYVFRKQEGKWVEVPATVGPSWVS